ALHQPRESAARPPSLLTLPMTHRDWPVPKIVPRVATATLKSPAPRCVSTDQRIISAANQRVVSAASVINCKLATGPCPVNPQPDAMRTAFSGPDQTAMSTECPC